MLSHLAKTLAAFSLILSTASMPIWAAKAAASNDKKCTAQKHDHAKKGVPRAKPTAAKSVTLIETRKLDVQILSFGP